MRVLGLSLAALVMLAAFAPAAEPLFEKTNLFEAGTGGYFHYRIPGIVVTKKGTLLAYCEARKSKGGDWGTIDIWMRRSTDGGKTWEAARKIVTPPADAKKNPVALEQKLARPDEITCNNPVAIADHKTGAVHFLYCIEYARCFYTRSDDDGATFSEPVEITGAFEKFRPDYDWKVLATGPGHGIQMSNGRLLVPVWLSTGTGGHAHRPSAVSVIYSDDQGKSWNQGEIVVAHPEADNPSETAAVELADGRVMLNIRTESPRRLRAVSISKDGATGWTKLRFDEALPEPICFGSIVRFSKKPQAEKDRILFINPDNSKSRDRQNVSVRLSYDEGKTWPVVRSIEPGSSGYPDIAVGPDGTIYCFYERDRIGSHTQIKYLCVARFNLEWLTEGKDSYSP